MKTVTPITPLARAIGHLSMVIVGALTTVLLGHAGAVYADGSSSCNVSSAGNTTVECGVNSSASADRSSALGATAIATGVRSTAVGYSANASEESAVALGYSSDATEIGAIAIGGDGSDPDSDGAQATETASIAIGWDAEANAPQAIALGQQADATNLGSIALGSAANATQSAAIAIGSGSFANASAAIAIGDAQASGWQSIALGRRARSNGAAGAIAIGGDIDSTGIGAIASGESSIAIGTDSLANGDGTVALGQFANAGTGLNSIAIGAASSTTGHDGLSIGRAAQSVRRSVAIGFTAQATGERASALGDQASATGLRSTAVGTDAQATGADSAAIGRGSEAGELAFAAGFNASALGSGSTAIGQRSSADGQRSAAIGTDAKALGVNAAAIGRLSEASTSAFAGGFSANASGTLSTAIGAESVASGLRSTAIGDKATATAEGAMAIGKDAVSGVVNQIVFGSTGASYKLSALAGTGTRNLVVDANGVIVAEAAAAATAESRIEDSGVASVQPGSEPGNARDESTDLRSLEKTVLDLKRELVKTRDTSGVLSHGVIDLQTLQAAGFDEFAADDALAAHETAMFAALTLRHDAMRGDWLHTDRFHDALVAIKAGFRQQLGDEDYDKFLMLTGRTNRVVVASVLRGSPAAALGLLSGDTVERFAGERVFSVEQLRHASVGDASDAAVEMTVLRDGRSVSLTVGLGPLGVLAYDDYAFLSNGMCDGCGEYL